MPLIGISLPTHLGRGVVGGGRVVVFGGGVNGLSGTSKM